MQDLDVSEIMTRFRELEEAVQTVKSLRQSVLNTQLELRNGPWSVREKAFFKYEEQLADLKTKLEQLEITSRNQFETIRTKMMALENLSRDLSNRMPVVESKAVECVQAYGAIGETIANIPQLRQFIEAGNVYSEQLTSQADDIKAVMDRAKTCEANFRALIRKSEQQYRLLHEAARKWTSDLGDQRTRFWEPLEERTRTISDRVSANRELQAKMAEKIEIMQRNQHLFGIGLAVVGAITAGAAIGKVVFKKIPVIDWLRTKIMKWRNATERPTEKETPESGQVDERLHAREFRGLGWSNASP
jgi:chromosome segregation ATPase